MIGHSAVVTPGTLVVLGHSFRVEPGDSAAEWYPAALLFPAYGRLGFSIFLCHDVPSDDADDGDV